jgi:hypothetical protein
MFFVELSPTTFDTLQQFLQPIDILNLRLSCRALHHRIPHNFHAQVEFDGLTDQVASSWASFHQHGLAQAVKTNDLTRPADTRLLPLFLDSDSNSNSNSMALAEHNENNQIDARLMELLSYPNVNPSSHRNRLLSISCRFGLHTLTNSLLSHNKVDPSIHNPFHRPLQLASDYGHLECVELILNDGRIDPLSVLTKTTLSSHVHIIQRILHDPRVYCHLDVHAPSLLLGALQNKYFDVLAFLIESYPESVDPSIDDNKILFRMNQY